MLESLFNKVAGLRTFWRTSANDCFCTALAPLIVTYPFYFIFSTFFFIITATTDNISDVVFGLSLKGFKEFKSGIPFSLMSLLSLLFYFSIFFLSFSVLFHFFLSLLINMFMLINKRPYISCANGVESELWKKKSLFL